jgi:hypothetical protein
MHFLNSPIKLGGGILCCAAGLLARRLGVAQGFSLPDLKPDLVLAATTFTAYR